MSLGERQQWILKSIVDTYVSTAEPVGSRAIAQQSDSPISSATIRNEMAELEARGLLVQPHTSAGRIPTDLGYREYVDNLMTPAELPEAEKQEIRHELSERVYEFNDLLKRATSLLSVATGYASVSLTPSEQFSYVKQLKFLSIEPERVLVIVVLSAGLVRDRLIRISDLISSEQLQLIAGAIEESLQGIPIQEITLVTVESALEGIALPDAILNQLLYEAYISIKQADHLDVYMDGVQRLLVQPEFREATEVHRVYNTLHNDGLITGYLTKAQGQGPDRPFMIRIGQEIKLNGLEACSLVTTTYELGDRLCGRIGIIGPKRMEYEKVIPRISFIRESVKEYYDKKSENFE